MSAAQPLSSLLSAGAVVALTLAAPGTALADPGGADAPKGARAASSPAAEGKRDQAAQQPKGKETSRSSTTTGQPAAQSADGRRGSDGARHGEPANGKPANGKPGNSESRNGTTSNSKPAKDPRAKRADQPAATSTETAGQRAERKPDASGDPAGNNGTIKIDTVPGDPDRANRPHPSSGIDGGCAFVLQFFNFDAGQTADITFTGQAPTRSAGPLLSLTGQTISTTPADGALEDGHSLTLTAGELGLVGTPTAAKGWHVKVAVDALEAPGGAKQKVFWLDCSSAVAPTVTEDEEQDMASTVGAKDAAVRSERLEQPERDALVAAFGDDAAVLSGSATRAAGTGSAQQGGPGVSGEAAAATAVAPVADSRSTTSVLPSVLPFTGAAGLAALLAAGLGAVGAGALAVRAGRRRTAAAERHTG